MDKIEKTLDSLSVSINEITQSLFDMQKTIYKARTGKELNIDSSEMTRMGMRLPEKKGVDRKPTKKVTPARKEVVPTKKKPPKKEDGIKRIPLPAYYNELIRIRHNKNQVEISYTTKTSKVVLKRTELRQLFRNLPATFAAEDILMRKHTFTLIDGIKFQCPTLIMWYFVIEFKDKCRFKHLGQKSKKIVVKY